MHSSSIYLLYLLQGKVQGKGRCKCPHAKTGAELAVLLARCPCLLGLSEPGQPGWPAGRACCNGAAPGAAGGACDARRLYLPLPSKLIKARHGCATARPAPPRPVTCPLPHLDGVENAGVLVGVCQQVKQHLGVGLVLGLSRRGWVCGGRWGWRAWGGLGKGHASAWLDDREAPRLPVTARQRMQVGGVVGSTTSAAGSDCAAPLM
jgi:hypothetical protein